MAKKPRNPRKDAHKGKVVRLDPDMHALLTASAAKNNRTITAENRVALLHYFAAHGVTVPGAART